MTIDRSALERAHDAARFRAEGHRLVDQLADHLARAASGEDLPVLAWTPPELMLERWPAEFPENGRGDLAPLMARLIADSVHQHHPRYVGYQVTPPLPLAALAELAAALLNNGMAAYEGGPAATAMEARIVAWMSEKLAWGPGADGVLTSGGSLGNLTALLAARAVRSGFDAWGEGAAAGPPLTVLAADQVHYSVHRAAQIMGWGEGGVTPVPVDARFRLRPDALDEAFARAERAGRRVIAVVASAGSTGAGAFDPLEAIADFCEARSLWLHVDGAHGASAALSPRYRGLLRGIERADSVVWDAHKMLAMPSLVTAVLFREGAHSWRPFAQEAAYLFAPGDGRGQWYHRGLRTIECTKHMMSVPLFVALSLLGTGVFADYVESTFDLARRFAARIEAAVDFELAVEPECNIVCFRHVPRGAGDLDALQEVVRRRVVESGAFFLVKTVLGGRVVLRTTLMNARTTDADLEALLDAIRAAVRP